MRVVKVRAALILLMAAWLAAPLAAEAGWKMRRATAIANVVWNRPCDGDIARFWAPLGRAFAVAHIGDCSVTFNSQEPWPWEKICTVVVHEWGHHAGYRDPTNAEDPDHSSNPESVMYVGPDANFDPQRGWVTGRDGKRRYVEDWTDTSMDERCRGNGRPYLEKHGLLKPRR